MSYASCPSVRVHERADHQVKRHFGPGLKPEVKTLSSRTTRQYTMEVFRPRALVTRLNNRRRTRSRSSPPSHGRLHTLSAVTLRTNRRVYNDVRHPQAPCFIHTSRLPSHTSGPTLSRPSHDGPASPSRKVRPCQVPVP